MDVRLELTSWLKVHAPAIWLTTKEESRAIALIKEAAGRVRGDQEPLIWSQTRGLTARPSGLDPSTQRLASALDNILEELNDGKVCILLDPDLKTPMAARALKDILSRAKGRSRSLVVVSYEFDVHGSIEDAFIKLELPPPSTEQLNQVLQTVLTHTASSPPSAEVTTRLIEAGRGMPLDTWQRTLHRMVLKNRTIGEAEVLALQVEKCRLVLTDPLLQMENANVPLASVGGMETYTSWVKQRRPYSGDGHSLRGVLMVGMPGCGQSMAVRAAATQWALPLIELDGMMLNLQRTSDPDRISKALQKIENSAPCVVALPRIDAAFDATGELGGKARTSGALVLERWLLNPNRKAIAIATAQSPDNLPLKLAVRGAFNKVFFVDLPNSEERRQILRMMLEKRGFKSQDLNLEMLVAASDGFSGSQIAQGIDRTLLEGPQSVHKLTMVDLLHSLRQTTPMAAHLGTTRRKLRAWAQRWAISASGPRES